MIGIIQKIKDNTININGQWFNLSKYPDKNVDFTKLRENSLYEFIILDNRYIVNYKEIKDNFNQDFNQKIINEDINNININENKDIENNNNNNKEKEVSLLNIQNIDSKIKNDLIFFIKDYKIAKMNALSHAIELYKLLYQSKIEKEKDINIDVNEVIEIANKIFNYIFNNDEDILDAYKNQDNLIKSIFDKLNKKEVNNE